MPLTSPQSLRDASIAIAFCQLDGIFWLEQEATQLEAADSIYWIHSTFLVHAEIRFLDRAYIRRIIYRVITLDYAWSENKTVELARVKLLPLTSLASETHISCTTMRCRACRFRNEASALYRRKSTALFDRNLAVLGVSACLLRNHLLDQSRFSTSQSQASFFHPYGHGYEHEIFRLRQ